MAKIVINNCFGGFSLSIEACNAIRAEEKMDSVTHGDGYCCYCDYNRTDPSLIRVVESLGSKRASGSCAHLVVVEVDNERPFIISEYDGAEGIRYQDEFHWIVLTEQEKPKQS